MSTDRLPVTDQGVMIPKVWFGNAKEVELRAQDGLVLVAPLGSTSDQPAVQGPVPADDPLWRLCDNPIDLDIADASKNLDKYLYDYDE